MNFAKKTGGKPSYLLKSEVMKIVYRAKISPELLIPVSVIMLGMAVLMIYENAWLGLLIIVLTSVFAAHLFLTTYYEIENDSLRIKCGFLYDKTIDIGSIRSVSKTRNPLSSPATSIDRLEVKYGQYDSVLISPKEKKAFVDHLQALNPAIGWRR